MNKSLFDKYHRPECKFIANGAWCICSCGLDRLIDKVNKEYDNQQELKISSLRAFLDGWGINKTKELSLAICQRFKFGEVK